VTVLIERYGGVLGGILGSTPSLIIVACIGFVLELYDDPQGFAEAIFSIPTGTTISCIFLYTWRVLPPIMPSHWTTKIKLLVMVISSFSVWFLLAIIYVFGVDAIYYAYDVPNIYIWLGLSALVIHMVFAPILVFFSPSRAPAGRHKVKPVVIFMRGLLGCLIIFVAVMLTIVDETAAGLASAFPTIFSTTMISLWISQDAAVPLGAIGPLLIGCTSVPMFSCLFYGFVVLFKPIISNMIWVIVISTLLAYIVAVLFCTIPAFLIIRCRSNYVDNSTEEDETTALLQRLKK